MYPSAFIVGTGRCGSTLLSKMLNAYSGITSVSEFFSMISDLGTMIPEAFPETAISGKQFWKILSAIYPKQNMMLRHGVAMKEVLYRCTPDSKYQASTGVPAILQTTLPHLSKTPDALFEDLRAEVEEFPLGSTSQQYQRFMESLCRRFDGKIWVERSGGSLRILHRLYDSFPNAKFVHLVRDGRNCAISMGQHYGFRMAMLVFQLIEILGVDPYLSDNRDWEEDLPDDLIDFLPENFNAEAFKNYQVPPSVYGHYWSGELLRGLEALEQIPSNQLLHVRYEDLLENPIAQFTRIIQFLDPALVNTQQIASISKIVGSPQSDWRALPEREKEFLGQACAVGMEVVEGLLEA